MSRILDRLKYPDDLKKLTIEELKQLAEELREYIIDVVSKTGGHLAPNLGVVELTIALHYVLSSPVDKIVWDVSHQAYVHKILTGRKNLFRSLRQFGGISGFTSREESEHDVYTTGHASTSIAYAMGLAEARDLKGTDEQIVAVIGDGALTGGVAYEALNNLGHKKTKMLVIINDNEMSIARNVGAISSYLTRIRLDPAYNRLRQESEKFIKNLPLIGEKVYNIGEQVKESIKALIVPGMLFEEMGLRYIGPVDGHNIDRLIRAISWSVNLDEPVVLHVVTRKGKGYEPAEKHPEYFHGSAPFDKKTGKPVSMGKTVNYTSVFAEALVEEARRNPRIVGITAAMPGGTGLQKLAETFPDRFYDVGISEQFAVTFAAGLAAQGLKPVCAIYSTFLQRAYDQLVQDVGLQNLPVIFAIDRGGLVGEDGPTHHGVFDLSYLRSIPGFIVAAPSDEIELVRIFKTAVESDSPFAFRYPRGSALGLKMPAYDEIEPMKEFKGRFLREGKDVAIIAAGRVSYEAVKAAELLEEKGISVTVYDVRFVKPLPIEEIENIARNHRLVVTAEENVINGGLGEALLREMAARGIETKVILKAISDKFIPHGKIDQLLHITGLDAEGLAAAVSKELTAEVSSRRSFRNFFNGIFKNGSG